MKNFLKQIYKTKVGNLLLSPLRWSYDFYRIRLRSDRQFIREKYKWVFGIYPDLENPKLFTEKLQWLKLNERKPLMTLCADKYRVREYIKETIGEDYLIPLVYDTDNPYDIRPENLPDYPVVIKQNHDSGYAMTFVYDKKTVDFKTVQTKLKKGARINYFWGNREWEYKHIKPHIIVEKLLSDSSGNSLLNDYKIYCFNGKPTYIQTIFDRTAEVKETWYDTSWNRQNIYYFSENSKDIAYPEALGEMLEVARKLAAPFVYARVDLYESFGKVYFGEITFRPYGGFMVWNPQEWDLKLGEKLKLPVDE